MKKNDIECSPKLDELDEKILCIITKNARTPFLEVARECGVSGAAIHQRVQRLLNLGVISGSEFVVDPLKMGYNTCAYIGVTLGRAKDHKQVAESLKNIPEVVECHYTTGPFTMIVKVVAKNNNHLKNIIDDELQEIEGISQTQTFVSLEIDFKRQIPIK
ncbi:MAG: Lrp/AsnC ligand binding domain-containing protein [Prolixibacteraceae bacterium]|nr:Lrp/AsnC ligand binding domain-containing protein [Prolixibacteraceae bacterium]